jgi:hypothetical protein
LGPFFAECFKFLLLLMSTRRIRRIRGKHLEVVPATSSTSVSSHSFTPEQFLPHLEVHEPIQVFVDRTSEDSRRIYREVIPIEPPSPIKRARFAAAQGSSESDARPASFAFPEADAHNDRYDMAFGDDEEPPAPEPAPRSRKGIFSVRLQRLPHSIFILFFFRD